jgi:hypothetical protein
LRIAVERLGLLLALVLAAGCGPRLPTPFAASDMAKLGGGRALVHYLGQAGATAAVCDRKGDGPVFRNNRPADFATLTDGLVDGVVRPKLWQRCAMLLLRSAESSAVSSFLTAMAHGYRALLSRRDLEDDSEVQASLVALHRAILDRPRGGVPAADAVADDLIALRAALGGGELGPFASKYGRALLATIDLERGVLQGQPVTMEVIDRLAAQKNERVLRRIMLRIPDRELERAARRRIVRLHIAASPSQALRDRAEVVETVVMATGRNAIDVTKTEAQSGWLDRKRAGVRGVLVRQNIWKQTATLLAYGGKRPGAMVMPSIKLRGALFLRVAGQPDPITLCAPPEALDVTPCLLPSDLHPTVPIVYIDEQGLLHFVERVTMRDAQRLIYNTPNLPLPFQVAGQTVLTIEWPVIFERPAAMVFAAPTQQRGPDLHVSIERRYAPRLLFEVKIGPRRYGGVVENSDFASFSIVTRGGRGTPGRAGTSGSNGTAGTAGMSASCPGSRGQNGGNGGRGGNGTSGGAGGPGGPGGKLMIRVACVTGDCASVLSAARTIARSEGGAGGPGGRGGQGGQGGPGGTGGSSTSCRDSKGHTTYLSGGSQGMRGANGSTGASGTNGANGSPGPIDIRMID